MLSPTSVDRCYRPSLILWLIMRWMSCSSGSITFVNLSVGASWSVVSLCGRVCFGSSPIWLILLLARWRGLVAVILRVLGIWWLGTCLKKVIPPSCDALAGRCICSKVGDVGEGATQSQLTRSLLWSFCLMTIVFLLTANTGKCPAATVASLWRCSLSSHRSAWTLSPTVSFSSCFRSLESMFCL